MGTQASNCTQILNTTSHILLKTFNSRVTADYYTRKTRLTTTTSIVAGTVIETIIKISGK